jgi:hypothetical protein
MFALRLISLHSMTLGVKARVSTRMREQKVSGREVVGAVREPGMGPLDA